MSSSTSERNIYTVGGTVQASNGLYISRKADGELLDLCLEGTFAYVLSTRQVGKSSLMIRTAEELSRRGIRSVIIDLTKMGVQVTASEWYLGLLALIEDQLSLQTDAVEWWEAHANVGITQRLNTFFEEVLLKEITAPIVIFVDEIDTTLRLSFTDDFFAAIRYLFSARATNPDLSRLSFVLIGVATPSDLIRDATRTPFNVGQRVDISDWNYEEALPLAKGLHLQPEKAGQVLKSVLRWTGGHPYLTQRLCIAIADEERSEWSETDIDEVVTKTFLGESGDKDSNLRFVRQMLLGDPPGTTSQPEMTDRREMSDLSDLKVDLLLTYRNIFRSRPPVRDEEQSLIKSHLKLSGVVCRENGILRVRNPIYREVFNEKWITQHLPPSWTKKQLARAKRIQFALIALLILVALLTLLATVLAIKANSQTRIANEQTKLAQQQTKLAVDSAQREAEARQEAEQARREAERAAQSEAEARKVAETKSQLTEQAADREKKARDEALRSAHREAVARKEAEAGKREAENQRRHAQEEQYRAQAQTVIANNALMRVVEESAKADAAKKEAEAARNEALEQTKKADEERRIRDEQRQLAEDRATTEQLYREAFDLTRNGRREEALAKFEKALGLYQHREDKVGKAGLASTHRRMGEIYGELSRLSYEEGVAEKGKLALEHFNSALKLYPESDDPLGEALTYRSIGEWYASRVESDAGESAIKEHADEYFAKSAELYEKFGNYEEAAMDYLLAGNFILRVAEGPKADSYFIKAIEASGYTGNRKSRASVLRKAGGLYYEKYCRTIGIPALAENSFAREIRGIEWLGEPGKQFIAGLQKSADYYAQASNVYHDVGDTEDEIITLRQSAQALYYTGKKLQAIPLLQKAANLSITANVTSQIGSTYFSLGYVYQKIGESQKAIQAFTYGYPHMRSMEKTYAKSFLNEKPK
jgi:tetratricopeptide (TPR) repeat protein